MATGNKCSQPHTRSPRHGDQLCQPASHPAAPGSPSTHTPGARTCSCPLAEEGADDGNQQTLEPGPLSMKPPVLADGLPALPQPRLCRGRSASAHHGCPALGPPASSQWADSVTRATRPLGRPFHSDSLLPRSPGP